MARHNLSKSEGADLINNSSTVKSKVTNNNPELKPLLVRTRLNNWHTNEEIFNILKYCDFVLNDQQEKNASMKQTFKTNWLSVQVPMRPRNGSVFLFDRRLVKNFKKDSFLWKRRKTGGLNSVREDRMCLKVNGENSIYGCYSHSSIITTFHRRCYWLLDKPDIVLVHYLQVPNNDTGDCLIVLNSCNFNINPSVGTNESNDFQMSKDDLVNELNAILWPYYLEPSFVYENLKLNNISVSDGSQNFINIITTNMLNSLMLSQQSKKEYKTNSVTFRINLLTNMNILNKFDLENASHVVSTDQIEMVDITNDKIELEDDFEKLFNHFIESNDKPNLLQIDKEEINGFKTNSFKNYHINYNQNQVYLSSSSCNSTVSNNYIYLN